MKAARTPVENAQLALLLEVSGTPKPGNVDRHRDLEELRFEQFMAGAVGARRGLQMAANGAPLGAAFEEAVAGMATQKGGNTQFGCLLLVVPLLKTALEASLTPKGVRSVVEATTIQDAVGFYTAFEHVEVAVGEPPADASALDVCHGSDVASTLRERELTLYDIMALSANPDGRLGDGNACEWVSSFERTFRAADLLLADEGPLVERTARVFLQLLAERPDTLVALNHGEDVAREVSARVAGLEDDLEAAEQLATAFVERGYNPGTTADITAAALFVALQRGLSV